MPYKITFRDLTTISTRAASLSRTIVTMIPTPTVDSRRGSKLRPPSSDRHLDIISWASPGGSVRSTWPRIVLVLTHVARFYQGVKTWSCSGVLPLDSNTDWRCDQWISPLLTTSTVYLRYSTRGPRGRVLPITTYIYQVRKEGEPRASYQLSQFLRRQAEFKLFRSIRIQGAVGITKLYVGSWQLSTPPNQFQWRWCWILIVVITYTYNWLKILYQSGWFIIGKQSTTFVVDRQIRVVTSCYATLDIKSARPVLRRPQTCIFVYTSDKVIARKSSDAQRSWETPGRWIWKDELEEVKQESIELT